MRISRDFISSKRPSNCEIFELPPPAVLQNIAATSEHSFTGDRDDSRVRISRDSASSKGSSDFEKPFTHEICGKKLNQQNTLQCHPRIQTRRKAECPVCKRTFTKTLYLKRHLRLHTGKKPYAFGLKTRRVDKTKKKRRVCRVCGKNFTRPSSLKAHRAVHTKEKRYACPVCGKKFAHPSSVKRHQLLHPGERPYACRVCGRKFASTRGLKVHQFAHTGKRSFECEICGKKFTRKYSMTHHKMITHTGISATSGEKNSSPAPHFDREPRWFGILLPFPYFVH